MKRLLITGGAGFIGSHTADLFLQLGLEVVVLDNLVSGKLNNLNLFHPHIRIVQGDILDYSTLFKEISACDAVLHLAALPSVPKSLDDPLQTFKVNTQGFLHVLEAIRESKRPIRLVYASSAAVYGAAVRLPCLEEERLSNPVLSPYALEKANNERYAELYSRLFGIRSLGLRYFNVYGLRQDPYSPYSGVISKFIEQYKNNNPITIFGDGRQSRDFIHVSDVAKANRHAIQSDYSGVLNIGTGVPETLNQLVRYIEQSGLNEAQVINVAPRVGDISESYASILKAKEALGFEYVMTLTEGIKEIMINK